MEILNSIKEQFEKDFEFLNDWGYHLLPITVENVNNPKIIYLKMKYQNISINREFVIIIRPRDQIYIDAYLRNTIFNEGMSLVNFIAFSNGAPPRYNPPFTLNAENLNNSIDDLSKLIKSLFDHELKNVKEGNEWIDIPVYDVRDEY